MQNVADSSTDQWNEAFTLYNLTDPQIFANPYPWYEQLRRFGPVYLDQTMGYVCTGFAEGEQILKDQWELLHSHVRCVEHMPVRL